MSTPKPEEQVEDCRLEFLPPEIRRHILSMLDLAQLSALVHASPTFHQQYRIERKHLLCQSLEETLGSLTADAYVVYLSASLRDSSELLKCYLGKPSRRCPLHIDKLTEEAAVRIAGFYLQLVKPLAEEFAGWALDNLATEVDNSHGQLGFTPTGTEMMRLTRAAYRFQLLCQLAGPSDMTLRASESRALDLLLNMIEPWEIEELFVFYQFAREVYDKVFIKIHWDIHKNNPKFDDQGRPPTPDGAFDLDSGFLRGNYLEGTTLRGLPLLHTVLFQVKDHEHLVSTMQEQIRSSYIPINASEGLFGDTHQQMRRVHNPTERDRMQDDRVPLVFARDELHGPPRAWTMIWGDTYSNLFGSNTSDDIRRWGYVFWDVATLERTGGDKLLRRQWDECWEGYDPREDSWRELPFRDM
ncbi:hypothetical protein ACHAPT_002239 [Fusarium lateritium]